MLSLLPMLDSSAMASVPNIIYMGRVNAPLNVDLLHTGVPSVKVRTVQHIVKDPPIPQAVPSPHPTNHNQHPLRSPQQQALNLPDPPGGSSYHPVTPIDPDHLFHILMGSPHAYELYIGFRDGFHVPHVMSPWKHPIRNPKSADQNPQFLDQYICKELSAGRIVGPFSSLPHHCIVYPLGLVPKHEAGAFRVIHDLSFPKGRGVNDLISNHLMSVSYEDFEFVISLIRQVGAGALIAKVDIQNAFRIMPIHVSDIHLFGFCWREQFYLDKCLPMGCSISCALFGKFSSALQHA